MAEPRISTAVRNDGVGLDKTQCRICATRLRKSMAACVRFPFLDSPLETKPHIEVKSWLFALLCFAAPSFRSFPSFAVCHDLKLRPNRPPAFGLLLSRMLRGAWNLETIRRVLVSGERVNAGDIWILPSCKPPLPFSRSTRKSGTRFFPRYYLSLPESS